MLKPKNYNLEVSKFLEEKKILKIDVVEYLRVLLLSVDDDLVESIKWNAPNYSLNGEDRITMRLFPEKSFQLVFHCGAKTKVELKNPLIKDETGILVWKSNDRAVIDLSGLDLKAKSDEVVLIAKRWLGAGSV